MADETGLVSAEDLFGEFEGDAEYEASRALLAPKTNLAINVNTLRRKQNLTQAQLAAAVGVRQPRIAEIERGDANARTDTVARIAYALHTTVSALYADPAAAERVERVARAERVVVRVGRITMKAVKTMTFGEVPNEWDCPGPTHHTQRAVAANDNFASAA